MSSADGVAIDKEMRLFAHHSGHALIVCLWESIVGKLKKTMLTNNASPPVI